MNEIDQAIDSAPNANDHQKTAPALSALPNGEIASHEVKPTASAAAKPVSFCSSRTLIYAMGTIAVLGIVCCGVVIAALETRPVGSGSGRQGNVWTDLAVQLQGQPLVASFNEYFYAPLRDFFVGGGH